MEKSPYCAGLERYQHKIITYFGREPYVIKRSDFSTELKDLTAIEEVDIENVKSPSGRVHFYSGLFISRCLSASEVRAVFFISVVIVENVAIVGHLCWIENCNRSSRHRSGKKLDAEIKFSPFLRVKTQREAGWGGDGETPYSKSNNVTDWTHSLSLNKRITAECFLKFCILFGLIINITFASMTLTRLVNERNLHAATSELFTSFYGFGFGCHLLK